MKIIIEDLWNKKTIAKVTGIVTNIDLPKEINERSKLEICLSNGDTVEIAKDIRDGELHSCYVKTIKISAGERSVVPWITYKFEHIDNRTVPVGQYNSKPGLPVEPISWKQFIANLEWAWMKEE